MRFIFINILALGVMGMANPFQSLNTGNLQPPKLERHDHTLEKHGDVRVDPYYWVKERENPKVVAHLNAENNYADSILSPAKKWEEAIFNEMKNRIVENEMSAPYKKDDYFYYSRYEPGQEYPLFARKHLNLKNEEELLLDGNKLAKDLEYFDLGGISVSTNHKMLIYAVDTVGRRFYDLHFRNLETNSDLDRVVKQTTGNVVWANDNETFYYTTQDEETLRANKLFRQTLRGEPELIYEEKDELYGIAIDKSLNKQTLFLSIEGMTASEIWIADANAKTPKFKLFQKREDKHEYSVEDAGNSFLILTNWKAKNFRVMETPKNATEKKNWKEIVPHDKNVLIEGLTVFKDYLVFDERFDGQTRLSYQKRSDKKRTVLNFPDPAYMASTSINAEYDTQVLRYVYESMVQPSTTYELNLETQEKIVIKVKQVPGYDSSLYESQRIFAKSHDGTRVPISLVYKKSLRKPKEQPLLVYGYGSYGISLDADFSSSVVSLLDRGFVFATAHIRGGSEMGREWYEDGKFLKKKNTFLDFIACTEHLVKEGFGHPEKVYAMGGSAGGLLMGAVINMRPDLYRGVVAQVPFVDVVTTMLDDSIPLTTIEYEEWGNPNDVKYYNYMKSYSPYDNLHSTQYPALLVTSGFHDSQVQYWEPTKWVAKLRDMNQGPAPVLLKTDMEAGHSGATGRYKSLKDTALEYSFLLWLESCSTKFCEETP